MECGIELFNREEFFRCHEVLEELWTPIQGPERLFLQSVIHMAVACYHCQRANWRGADGQFSKGLRKLAGYLPERRGIDTELLYRGASEMLESIRAGVPPSSYPRIRRKTE